MSNGQLTTGIPKRLARGNQSARWGVILAGGDGVRLRPLTRTIYGDDRPKQFCPIVNGETLLEITRRRISHAIVAERTIEIFTRSHQRFYAPLTGDLPPARVLIQPQNRGTAPAILYTLLTIAAQAPQSAVAIFPSDHHVSSDEKFMAHVNVAFEAIEANSESVILLGIRAEQPEVQYGWIERGDPALLGNGRTIYAIRRFWEKPPLDQAKLLFAQGCLWNSFVLVAHQRALLELLALAAPELYGRFRQIERVLGTPSEAKVVEAVYQELPNVDCSRDVLAVYPERLAVLPVADVRWNDLGEPTRVINTLKQINDKDFEFAVARSLH